MLVCLINSALHYYVPILSRLKRDDMKAQANMKYITNVADLDLNFFLFSYKDVCNVCSLDDDIKLMPSGDLTEVILILDPFFFMFYFSSNTLSLTNIGINCLFTHAKQKQMIEIIKSKFLRHFNMLFDL